jgi:glutamate 5-kinase
VAGALIVVKVGSGVLAPGGGLDSDRIGTLARDIMAVRSAGHRVVLVSSGAVASGLSGLGLGTGLGVGQMPTTIVHKQAAAAIGQPKLMQTWASAFAVGEVRVAQVLLTADDLDHRGRFLNARRTLEALLDAGVVPIINENDSVAFEEIRFGDNDRLSALVASLLDADLLLLLSVVPGVQDASGAVVPELVSAAEGQGLVRPDRSATGVGGMASKIASAQLAADAGTDAVIASGLESGIIARVARGERAGTRLPALQAAPSKKRWIGQAARPRGSVTVDEGAVRAIAQRGASLLPAGVRAVEGGFEAGSVIDIRSHDGRVVARGLASYGAADIRKIAGRRSDEIAGILGFVYAEEVVHREDMHVMEARA